jgi:hypothetical protein
MLCDKQNAIKMAKKLGVHRKDKTYWNNRPSCSGSCWKNIEKT